MSEPNNDVSIEYLIELDKRLQAFDDQWASTCRSSAERLMKSKPCADHVVWLLSIAGHLTTLLSEREYIRARLVEARNTRNREKASNEST